MKRKKLYLLNYILPMLLLCLWEFMYHRSVHFIMDDEWYATNLVTGAPLNSIKDIFESQVWHYLNWGGRSITHTVLQFTLWGGELVADICNIVMTVVLAIVISSFAKEKSQKLRYVCLSTGLLIALNASIMYSMFWQAGVVNYVYSSVWILTFLRVYLRELDEGEVKPLWGVSAWIIPLGLMTGWSNENVGPASFLASVLVIILLKKKKNVKRIPWWMTLGSFSAFIGSVLVVIAPGNFKRSEFSNDSSLIAAIRNRSFNMLEGISSFLLPTIAIMLVLMLVVTKVIREKIALSDIVLVVTAVLALGAMILSPHFPARASFGIMVICIVVILSMLETIVKKFPGFFGFYKLFLISIYVYSVIEIMMSING